MGACVHRATRTVVRAPLQAGTPLTDPPHVPVTRCPDAPGNSYGSARVSQRAQLCPCRPTALIHQEAFIEGPLGGGQVLG